MREDDRRGKRAKRTGGPRMMVLVLCLVHALLGFFAIACDRLPDPAGNIPEGGQKPTPGDTAEHYAAFVVTTDYSLTGGFGVIDLDTLNLYSPDPVWAANIVSPDPVVVAAGAHIFVINRYTYDSISLLDAKFNLVKQYSVADSTCNPSNPHDLAYVNDQKAYLTVYECAKLWIINPLTGAKLGTIDLSAYGGGDGVPEMSGMLLHGDTLFVAVQMLDRGGPIWGVPDHSRLVMIDVATDSVVGDVLLAGSNPVTDLMYSDSLGAIMVGEVGSYFVTGDGGGIEAVDPDTGTSLGFLIDETALGGNLGDFEILSATRGYATITTDDFRSVLVAFNPTTGARDAGVVYASDEGFTLWDIALTDGGLLLVCDRTATAPGVAVIDTRDGDRVVTRPPIYLGLPPFSIALLK